MDTERPVYGGQAVIEGVMMRGPKDLAIAVRLPSGEIDVHKRPINLWTARHNWNNIPFLRGIGALVEALVLGTSALMYSAEHSAEEDEQLSRGGMIMSLVLAMVLAVGLFMVFPTFIVGVIRRFGPPMIPLVSNLIEGGLRLCILIGYIAIVSRVEDVGRVLAYHGAEHKVIHAFEKDDLSLGAIRVQSTLHPRCGTSFLLFVVIISVLLFSLFGWPNVLVRTALRLGLLPIIAALSYEVIRFSGRSKLKIMRAAIWPGLMLQRLTTKNPDDSQIEVALNALSALVNSSDHSATGVEPHVGQVN